MFFVDTRIEICDNEKCRDDGDVGIDDTWDAYFHNIAALLYHVSWVLIQMTMHQEVETFFKLLLSHDI